MEAKDTVINLRERQERLERVGIPANPRLGELYIDSILEYQAEISFKAGREAEREWAASNQYRDEQIGEAKQVGIREVVEWIRTQQLPKEYQAEEYRGLVVIVGKFWQAKLKEWKVKEVKSENY